MTSAYTTNYPPGIEVITDASGKQFHKSRFYFFMASPPVTGGDLVSVSHIKALRAAGVDARILYLPNKVIGREIVSFPQEIPINILDEKIILTPQDFLVVGESQGPVYRDSQAWFNGSNDVPNFIMFNQAVHWMPYAFKSPEQINNYKMAGLICSSHFVHEYMQRGLSMKINDIFAQVEICYPVTEVDPAILSQPGSLQRSNPQAALNWLEQHPDSDLFNNNLYYLSLSQTMKQFEVDSQLMAAISRAEAELKTLQRQQASDTEINKAQQALEQAERNLMNYRQQHNTQLEQEKLTNSNSQSTPDTTSAQATAAPTRVANSTLATEATTATAQQANSSKAKRNKAISTSKIATKETATQETIQDKVAFAINNYHAQCDRNKSSYNPLGKPKCTISYIANYRKRLVETSFLVFALLSYYPEYRERVNIKALHKVKHQEVLETMRASDIFIISGYMDSHNLPAVEAMACGCHVVGYTGLSYPVSYFNDTNGWFFKEETALRKHVEILKEAIDLYYAGDEQSLNKRKTLLETAVATVAANFSSKSPDTQIVDSYRRIWEKRHAGSNYLIFASDTKGTLYDIA